MASVLHLAHKGVRHMDLGMGAAGFALNTGIEFGAGAGIGYAHGRFRDKFVGKHAHRLAAIAGKGAALVTGLMGGPRLLAGAFDSFGAAGVAIWGCDVGLEHGRKAAGNEVQLVKAGTALSAGAQRITGIGALPPADNGHALTMAQIRELASMH